MRAKMFENITKDGAKVRYRQRVGSVGFELYRVGGDSKTSRSSKKGYTSGNKELFDPGQRV